MEKFKNMINSNQKFIICLLFAILSTSIFTIFMFNSNSTYSILKSDNTLSEFDFLEDAALKVNDINSSLSLSLTGLNINVDESLIALENNISNLNIIKSYLSSFVVTEDSTREILPILNKSINDTLTLYDTCLLALNDDLSISEVDYLSEIKILQSNCASQYESLAPYNIELVFSYESISFFEGLYTHLDSIYSDNKYSKIKESQVNDFVYHLKSNLNNFSSLLQDLYPAVERIRTDNRGLDVILSDIQDKELQFSEIKESTLSTSIPEGYDNFYEDAIYIFDLYSNYITSLKVAVIYENSSSYETNKENIDINYENALSKLEDVSLEYDSLIKSLNNL